MSNIEKRIEARKEKRKKKKRLKTIILLILLILIAIICGIYYYFSHLYKTTSYEDIEDNTTQSENLVSDVEDPVEPEYTKVEGITNILLLGLDARNPDETSRSDSIIILTIDTIHNDLKLTSIMRDSYVTLYQKDEQKINSAYAYGGTSLLMNTIESNFDVDLDKYAIIDFNGFKELVDIVGGLDLTVEDYMIDEMNLCIKELGDEDSKYVTEAGLQHLDGDQVLGYSRMRNIKGNDYARTERQREVISLLMEKIQDVPKYKYTFIAAQLLPYLKTNIELTQAFNLAYTVFSINNYDVQQLQIPVNELSTGLIHPNKGWLLVMDIDQNAQLLNDFIFEDIPYDSSNVSYTDYKNYISRYFSEVNALETKTTVKTENSSTEKTVTEKATTEKDDDEMDNDEETNAENSANNTSVSTENTSQDSTTNDENNSSNTENDTSTTENGEEAEVTIIGSED
ncbi:LCP family protein [Clostridium sp. DL1XJH146]